MSHTSATGCRMFESSGRATSLAYRGRFSAWVPRQEMSSLHSNLLKNTDVRELEFQDEERSRPTVQVAAELVGWTCPLPSYFE